MKKYFYSNRHFSTNVPQENIVDLADLNFTVKEETHEAPGSKTYIDDGEITKVNMMTISLEEIEKLKEAGKVFYIAHKEYGTKKIMAVVLVNTGNSIALANFDSRNGDIYINFNLGVKVTEDFHYQGFWLENRNYAVFTNEEDCQNYYKL